MKDKKFYKLHIFSPGSHRSANGHKVTMSADDLRRTSETFVSNHRVPLCLGHSTFKHNDIVPSMGWFRDVKQDEDGELYGLVEATTAGSNLLEGGYYENFSASFYSPDSPLNPKPGTWTLRHVAALGGDPPALKELDPMLEMLPEDFSEVQDYNTWYEFKESDSEEYVSFSEVSKLLPDTYDFKSFRKFGKKLRCKNGWHQCGGRCLPPDQKCGGQEKAKKFQPGTRKDFKKDNYNKTKKPFVSKEQFAKDKKLEKAARKDTQTSKNLVKGTIKGLAATGVALAATYGGEMAFPNDKTAQSAVNLIGNVAAKQFVVSEDATVSDRLKMAAVSGLQGSVELAVKQQLEGNAYAGTMAKASSGIISTVLIDSGLIELKYDSYANKFHNATATLASAVKDTSEWKANNKKEKNEFEKRVEEIKNEVRKNQNPLSEEALADSIQRTYKRAASAEAAATRAAGNANRMKRDFQRMLEAIINDADPASAMDKANLALQALNDLDPNREFSENLLKYPNSQVNLQFSRGEIAGLLLPLALSLLKAIGGYSSKEQGRALSKSVKSGNPKLEAVFSELDTSTGILKHDISNDELAEALFGSDRLTRDFSEGEENTSRNRGKKRRRKNTRNSSEFQENNSSQPRRKVLAIDAILDDAMAQAEDFSEGRPVKKSVSPKQRTQRKKKRVVRHNQNFRESIGRRYHSQRTMDFSESAEYQRLTTDLAKVKREKRQVEVANFAETLYQDGVITEGIAKKSDFVDFMIGLEDAKESFNFGEGSSIENPYKFMTNLLENLEPIVSFNEVITEQDSIIAQPKFEDGYDLASQKLDYQINLMLKADPELTYEQAWAKVAGRSM